MQPVTKSSRIPGLRSNSSPTATADHATLIDGKVVNRFEDDGSYNAGGHIALAATRGRVQFRKIEILELDDSGKPISPPALGNDEISLVRTFTGHQRQILSVAWSPDGRWAATCGKEARVLLWDTATWKLQHTFAGHGKSAICVTFSPDSKLIASGDSNGSVMVWDVDERRLHKRLAGHEKMVTDVQFALDGQTLWSVSNDNTLRRWNVESGDEVSLSTTKGQAEALAVVPDGTVVTAGQAIQHWAADGKPLPSNWSYRGARIYDVAVSPDGSRLIVGNAKGNVLTYHVEDGNLLHENQLGDGYIESLAVTSNGRLLLAGTLAKTLAIIGLESGNIVSQLQFDTHCVNYLALSPDDEYLLTGGGHYWQNAEYRTDGDYALRLWRLSESVRSENRVASSILKQALAFYTFEEDTFFRKDGRLRVRDLSGNGLDASVEDEQPAYAPNGKLGGALVCNRKVHKLPLPKLRLPTALLSGRDEYTVTLWVRDSGKATLPSGKSVRTLYQEGFPKGADAAYPLSVNVVEQQMRILGLRDLVTKSYEELAEVIAKGELTREGNVSTEEGTIPKEEWYFLALTLTRKGDAHVLRVTINDKTTEHPFAPVPQLEDGFGLLGGIDGRIDEVAFFGRALSEEEIKLVRDSLRALPSPDEFYSLDERRVKELVAEAAGMTNEDYEKIAGASGLPNPAALESKSLSLMLFSLLAVDIDFLAKTKPGAEKDFRWLTDGQPKAAQVGTAIWKSRNKGYASFIQPEYVTDVTLQIDNLTAHGTVSFAAPDLYEGNVRYVARKKNGRWIVEEFHLENIGLSLRRRENGQWDRMQVVDRSGEGGPREFNPLAAAEFQKRLRQTLSHAAGIPNDQWEKLATSPSPSLDLIEGDPLSLVLFSLNPYQAEKGNTQVLTDFRYLTPRFPKPSDVSKAMSLSSAHGYYSMIQPEYITDTAQELVDGKLVGSVEFEAPDLYAGKVDYLIELNGPRMSVVEFSLPNYGITIERGEDGSWVRRETEASDQPVDE